MKSTLGTPSQKGTVNAGSPFSFSIRGIIPAVILAVPLFLIYLITMAPGLTWANGGADGGDLITASAVGGVPHPTGYPLYLILSRVFQFLPIGTLAYRTNLMSAVFAVMTALLVYSIVMRDSPLKGRTVLASAAGLSAGYAIGLAPMFWSQAVITEVYTLHGFLVALILYLSLVEAEIPSVRSRTLDRVVGFVIGLACGNHLTILLIVPMVMLIRGLRNKSPGLKPDNSTNCRSRFWVDWRALVRQFIWMLLGLLIYLVLPLRALNHPPVNWGNPVTLENFWWLVSGELYRLYYLADPFALIWTKTRAGLGLVLQQFGLYGVTLVLMELVVFTRASRLNALTGWIGLVSWALALGYQSSDSYIYLIPFFISCSIWLGLCVGQILFNIANHKPLWRWLFLSTLLINLSLGLIVNWDRVDASKDDRAHDFGRSVFSTAPQNAIVFVKSDPVIFAAWYFHYALGERPDLAIIATDLLHFDWYQQTLWTTYPALVVPGPFPFDSTIRAANPSRTTCYADYDEGEWLKCSGP